MKSNRFPIKNARVSPGTICVQQQLTTAISSETLLPHLKQQLFRIILSF
jgi:hypothetical protein